MIGPLHRRHRLVTARPTSLDGKVALVTGAGSGIGEATARTLAALGAGVLVVDIDADAAMRVAAAIRGTGGRAAPRHVDVADAAQVATLIPSALEAFGALDLAVNNAGFGHDYARLHEVPDETWDSLMAVNLRGTWLCMKAELAHFLRHGGGAIVNTASAAGLRSLPGRGVYSVSKHGIVGLTRNAAIEYAADGIRVNAVAPATVNTPQIAALPAAEREKFAAAMPAGRVAEPREVAEAIAWLLSDAASYVSGEILQIDYAHLQA